MHNQEVVNLLINKYSQNSNDKDQILKQSIEKLMLHNKLKPAQIQKLRSTLQQSQSSAAFFPSVEPTNTIIPQSAASKNNNNKLSTEQSQKFFKTRLQPFQRTIVNHNEEAESQCSEKHPKSIYFVDRNDEDEWAALVKFDAQMFTKDQQRRKQLEQEKKRQMKQELDKQVMLKKQKQNQEQQQNQNYNRFSNELISKQQQAAQLKIVEEQKAYQKLQQDRQLQLRLLHQKKQQQRREEQQYKEMLNRKYQHDYQQEVDEKNNNKLKTKDFLYNVMKLSEEEKEIQQRKEKEALLQEQAESNKHGQILDQLEHRRMAEHEQRLEKIRKIGAWSENQNQKYVLEKADDNKFSEQQKLQNIKFEEEEQKKREKIHRWKSQVVETLNQQVQNKQHKLHEDKQLDLLQGQLWKEDTNQYYQEEQQKHESIQKIKLEHRMILEQQIQNRLKPERGDKMSLLELMQNKQALKTIRDEDVYDLEKVVI